MNIEEIIQLELDGITKTICDYTSENFILSYTEKIIKMDYPKDKKNIGLLVSKLIEWYSTNILDIQNNNYIVNKNEHEKSYKLLKDLQELLID